MKRERMIRLVIVVVLLGCVSVGSLIGWEISDEPSPGGNFKIKNSMDVSALALRLFHGFPGVLGVPVQTVDPSINPDVNEIMYWFLRTGTSTVFKAKDWNGVAVPISGTPGPTGPQGPQGPTGPQGPAGAGGVDVSVRVQLGTSPSVPNSGNGLIISWPAPTPANGGGYQDGGAWWTSAQPTRLTIPSNGKYDITCGAQLSSHATGNRQMAMHINGFVADTPRNNVAGLGGGTNVKLQLPIKRRFNANDYLEFSAWQSSGASLTLIGGENTFCAIHKLAP